MIKFAMVNYPTLLPLVSNFFCGMFPTEFFVAQRNVISGTSRHNIVIASDVFLRGVECKAARAREIEREVIEGGVKSITGLVVGVEAGFEAPVPVVARL